MNIERLVTMANEIAAFFASEKDSEQAAQLMATHLRRYWEPRMRRAIIEHERAGGAGLSELARRAIASVA
jgi:formate dehydrogenase subunit delta